MVKKWKKLKEKSTTVGFRKILSKTFQMPDGQISRWDIKQEGPVVCVLALTTDQKVILNKQFRPGPEKILLEMPGGMIDKGETPLQAIKRELLEETGYTGHFKLVGKKFACAYSDRVSYTFVATACRQIQKQHLENDEFIEVTKMSLKDFRKHLQKGQLTDTKSGYLALDYLKLL